MAAPGFALAAAPAAEHPGAVIYRKLCEECHGAKGEGVAGKYDDPLTGDRTLESLARRIDRTMPEDNEEACNAEESAQVAAYIYDAFYSPAAQARVKPPAKDLARLTIPQYRNSVADLIGRFRPGFDKPPGKERGLRGSYRGSEVPPPPPPAAPDAKPPESKPKAEPKKEEEKKKPYRFERMDGRISFQFGADSPDKAKMLPQEFTIRWDGSVIAEETGVYEFVIKTENGARLWVNDRDKALIDAWVSSGPEVREEGKSLFLIGGRAYPIALEHFKFQEKSASIELLWKPPHGVLEVIPQRFLSPERLREIMVVGTSFPADDRSMGYERGIGISKAWDQATTEGAIATAEHVEEHVDELSGSKAGSPDRVDKLKNFCRAFAEAAFRRPLTEEQRQALIEPHFQAAKSPELAVKRVVLFTLKSPRFLYPELVLGDQPDAYDVAARLALALWDSLPDRKLLEAAAQGKLKTREELLAQARRMLPDPRTKAKLHGFFHHWLELERADSISKDPKAFPGFNESVVADLRTSLKLFLDQVVWGEKSDYRELLNAEYVFMNSRLASLYNAALKPQGDDFEKVAFSPGQRAGVVTHPFLLTAFAYSKQSSPIHRGVFLTRNIVGMPLKEPAMAVTFEESHFNPTLTMREKITELTRDNSCMACHSVINPLGFSLENYDAIGRWRTKDNNKPVNPVAELPTEEGQVVKLTGPRDVVRYATETPGGHLAFIRHLFNHTVKQPHTAYGPNTLEDLRASFTRNSFNIQALLSEMAVVAALEGATPPPAKDTAATAPAR